MGVEMTTDTENKPRYADRSRDIFGIQLEVN